MADYGLNLWDYWRIINKRKWIIILVFLASVASTNMFSQKTEPFYRSTATLYIDSSRTPVAEITGGGVTFWGGGGDNLATQLELIKSYSILKTVAIELGDVKGEKDPRLQDVIDSLKAKISVEEVEGTDLVNISATDTDPVRSREIASTVARVFINDNWERKISEARKTKAFVEQQLKKMDKEITDAKRKLRALGVTDMAFTPGASTDDAMISMRTRLVQLNYKLSTLRERYTDKYPPVQNILSEIKSLEKHLGDTGKDKVGPGDLDAIDADKLRSELEINQELYILLKERYEKAKILEASQKRDIEIVDPAEVPRMPATVPAAANMFLGGIIGLVLGFVGALVAESMDTSIGTIEDVEEYLRLPVLGVIPHIEVKKEVREDFWKDPPSSPEEKKKYTEIMGRLITQFRPKSPIAESYRNLQTYIKFSGLEKFGNALMFTSAGVQEGKTITSVNCALSMAQMGYKVLLVDCDLRRPSVHKVFGIERETGLTEAVLGTFKLEDVVKTMDDIMMGNIKSSMIMQTYGMENLNIVTAGHIPSNPTEILSSQNMSDLIKQAKDQFQVVLFDSAPILPVTDSCILSSKLDGVILVYEVGRVSRGALRRCKTQLEVAKGRPIGVVLNSMRASDMRFGSPFYYHYQKYYGEDKEEIKRS